MTVTIRYQTIDRRSGLPVTRERSFPSETAMEKWVARQEALAEQERGGFIGVTAFATEDR